MTSVLGSLSPWFTASLRRGNGADVRAQARDAGFEVTGYAASPHGPFTARLLRDGAFVATGCGSTARESIERALRNAGEVAA